MVVAMASRATPASVARAGWASPGGRLPTARSAATRPPGDVFPEWNPEPAEEATVHDEQERGPE